MAAAVPFLMAAGTVASTLGVIQTAQSEKAAARYNQQLAEQNAASSLDAARVEEQRHRMQTRKHLGQMRANYGASGVTVDGSIEDVLADSATQAEWDALLIRHAGQQRARGYSNEAGLYGARARNASASGYLTAAGTLASGAARTYQVYDALQGDSLKRTG